MALDESPKNPEDIRSIKYDIKRSKSNSFDL
jgi:hypothetical protein